MGLHLGAFRALLKGLPWKRAPLSLRPAGPWITPSPFPWNESLSQPEDPLLQALKAGGVWDFRFFQILEHWQIHEEPSQGGDPNLGFQFTFVAHAPWTRSLKGLYTPLSAHLHLDGKTSHEVRRPRSVLGRPQTLGHLGFHVFS